MTKNNREGRKHADCELILLRRFADGAEYVHCPEHSCSFTKRPEVVTEVLWEPGTRPAGTGARRAR
jgi:hypothetical protein